MLASPPAKSDAGIVIAHGGPGDIMPTTHDRLVDKGDFDATLALRHGRPMDFLIIESCEFAQNNDALDAALRLAHQVHASTKCIPQSQEAQDPLSNGKWYYHLPRGGH